MTLLSIGASLVMYFGVKSKLGTRILVKWMHLFSNRRRGATWVLSEDLSNHKKVPNGPF